MDIACTQYDNNRLAYIPWEKCTSRTDEQEKDLKKDQTLTLDVSSGKLKVDKKKDEILADVQSDLKVQQALQRRALAYNLFLPHKGVVLWLPHGRPTMSEASLTKRKARAKLCLRTKAKARAK